jgi:outer membrane biosynthesis protein TonB
MVSTGNRHARTGLVIGALALGLMLGGCETFDPTDLFSSDIFSTKKKLPGERKPVFPEGTPGVSQGVPPDLVKGYQQQIEQEAPPPQAAVEPEKAKPKPKPKPKVVAKPAESQPTSVTVRPAEPSAPQGGASQWPDPPQAQTQQSGGGWSGSQGPVGSRWPDPPPTR